MTPTETALDDIATCLYCLTLAVLCVGVLLVALNWTLEDLTTRVNLVATMIRLSVARLPVDSPSDSPTPTPAAGQAAKADRSENLAR
jgi:hypothetical protein